MCSKNSPDKIRTIGLDELQQIYTTDSFQNQTQMPFQQISYQQRIIYLPAVNCLRYEILVVRFGESPFSKCDQLGFNRKTKFMAKNYLDNYIVKNSIESDIEYHSTAIICAKLAVQHNQPTMLFSYDYAQLSKLYELNISQQRFYDIRLKIETFLKDFLETPTPYDYLETQAGFIGSSPAYLKTVEILIDFALTLPQTVLLGAKELFEACLLLYVRKRLPRYYPALKDRLIGQVSKIEYISNIIETEYQQITASVR